MIKKQLKPQKYFVREATANIYINRYNTCKLKYTYSAIKNNYGKEAPSSNAFSNRYTNSTVYN